MSRITAQQAGGANVCAFLDMLALSEIGAALLANAQTDSGYRVIVGSTPGRPLLFSSYATHPNVYNRSTDSTAAGRYQLLYRYWSAYQSKLSLPDFSPLSQDLVAIQQIKEQRALGLVAAGQLAQAIDAVANIWASLPGAGYGQRENSLSTLQAAFVAAGGKLA